MGLMGQSKLPLGCLRGLVGLSNTCHVMFEGAPTALWVTRGLALTL